MSDREVIETAQNSLFESPEGCYLAVAGKESIYLGWTDYCDFGIAEAATEGLQGALLGLKAHPHRLFMCHILGNRFEEFHSKPPRLNSATSRSPGRSTLA
jgi:hypothetical protein